MALRYYDEALASKIGDWFKDPNVMVLKPDEVTRLFQIRADRANDKPLALPLVAIARDTGVELIYSKKRVLTFSGKIIGSSTDSAANRKVVQLDAIPVRLNYQIDIYTRTYEEGDEYLRELIFKLVNNNILNVSFPYNGTNIQHIAHIILLTDVTDNSDISEKLFKDQFTRWTLRLELQDAYLFNIPVNSTYTLEVGDSEGVGGTLEVVDALKETNN